MKSLRERINGRAGTPPAYPLAEPNLVRFAIPAVQRRRRILRRGRLARNPPVLEYHFKGQDSVRESKHERRQLS